MKSHRSSLYDFASCRQADQISQEKGLSEIQLMGNAALASFYQLQKSYSASPQASFFSALTELKRIFILCGSGNNGGDGLALAYLLAGSSPFQVLPEILVFHSSGRPKSRAAQFYFQLLQEAEMPVLGLSSFLERRDFNSKDLFIEALLGTGQTSPPRGVILEILRHIRDIRSSAGKEQSPHLISLDIPAGLTEQEPSRYFSVAQTEISRAEGLPLPDGFSAPEEIHCYGMDKIALRLHPDLSSYSKILLFPIGFHPSSFTPNCSLKSFLYGGKISQEQNLSLIKKRLRKQPTDHKYKSGHSCIIGGSKGMEGAVLMAAKSFFAAGGGILHVLVPEKESRELLTAALPSSMFLTFEDWKEKKNHSTSHSSGSRFAETILIGPGLHPKDLAKAEILLAEEWKDSVFSEESQKGESPTILLDASSVQWIFSQTISHKLPIDQTVLLPHSGEWKQLGGPMIRDTSSLHKAIKFYQKHCPFTVLIKDCISVLLSRNSNKEIESVIFPYPNASLATAGSGDCLAGILLALSSRKRREGQSSRPSPSIKILHENILASLSLMHKVAGKKIHPRADQFADLLIEFLS